MFLRKGERISSFQYKTMHAVLNSRLRENGVDTDEGRVVFDHIFDVLKITFDFNYKHFEQGKVADEIRGLHFNDQVAICDVGNGGHSILLTGISRCGEWLSAFDPWWYPGRRDDNENVKFPDENDKWYGENVRIRCDHFIDDPCNRHRVEHNKGLAYPMGKPPGHRFLTIS